MSVLAEKLFTEEKIRKESASNFSMSVLAEQLFTDEKPVEQRDNSLFISQESLRTNEPLVKSDRPGLDFDRKDDSDRSMSVLAETLFPKH